MYSLTEQLRNGTLGEGFYYAKLPNNRAEIITDCGLDILREIKGGDKIEVLDIVPNYIQFQNTCSENEKLKELLEIAVNTLKRIKTQSELYFYFEEESSTNCDSYAVERSIYDLSLKTLKQIKELEMLRNSKNVSENVAYHK